MAKKTTGRTRSGRIGRFPNSAASPWRTTFRPAKTAAGCTKPARTTVGGRAKPLTKPGPEYCRSPNSTSEQQRGTSPYYSSWALLAAPGEPRRGSGAGEGRQNLFSSFPKLPNRAGDLGRIAGTAGARVERSPAAYEHRVKFVATKPTPLDFCFGSFWVVRRVRFRDGHQIPALEANRPATSTEGPPTRIESRQQPDRFGTYLHVHCEALRAF